MQTSHPIPQPRPLPIVRNALDLGQKNPVQSLMQLAKAHGPLYRLELPTRMMLVASSYELMHELCDETRFDKRVSGPLQQLRDFTGDGLFTAYTYEPNWAKAHRLLTPAFGPLAMRNYVEPMLDLAEQMLYKWERLGPDTELDVPDNMTRLTLDTIALCGFDYRFNSFYQESMHPFVDAMVSAMAEAGARTRRLSIQNHLMLITQASHQSNIDGMNAVVDRVIQERKASPEAEQTRDLLGLMLNSVDPQTGDRLDDINIRHQIITFLIAGHETTSGLLSFTIYQLLKHPEVMARATAEAQRVLGQQRPTFEHLRQLTYIDQVLRESLRLWPTAPAFSLYPREDTILGGKYSVQKGDPITVLLPQVHRDPAVWDDPETFDPERFSAERATRIPVDAWKPFGNGQRACIGRQFAMQEASLVLAMLLRRFELVDHTQYELKVKETLTLKPDGLVLKARVRSDVANETRGASPTVQTDTAASSGAVVATHGIPLLVLFGSNSGSSEAFARRIARDATRQGYDSTVASLDEHAGALPTTGAVVIVTASYNGQPPDNARKFWAWLDSLGPEALQGVHFSVFGCGHRDWAATYQAVPTRIDAAMEAAGATRLQARGEADGRADFFGDFDLWYTDLWPTFGEAFDVGTADEAAHEPRYVVKRVDGSLDPREDAQLMHTVEIIDSRELVDMSSPFGRSKREIELRLPEGMTYRAGDHLSVLAENEAELVARAARRFGLSPDDTVVVRPSQSEDCALPVDRPVTVHQLLARYVELTPPASRRDVKRLAAWTECPPEAQRLLELAGEPEAASDLYETEILAKRVSILELMEEFESCALPFGAFLELLLPMRARRYSISSSPLVDPTRCTLTVAVVDAPAWSGRGHFRGIASSYLARIQQGDVLPAMVRPPHAPFFLPDDPTIPVVMVAAGTGIAPFRAFVEERAALRRQGASLGPALLFFGCDHPEVDLLYRQSLETWEREGVVEIFTAFSRAECEGVSFVQHRLWAQRERVGTLLDRGARVYVCGDGRLMAPAVRDTFASIHQHHHGSTAEESEAWLRQMQQQQRYLADVFGG